MVERCTWCGYCLDRLRVGKGSQLYGKDAKS
jgi:hypothetical protein